MGDLRISAISEDVLNADAETLYARLSEISLDVLRVPTAATEMWCSAISLDVLRVPSAATGELVAIVNGVDQSSAAMILRETLVVVDELNEAPNSCNFVTISTVFTVGARVVLYLDVQDASMKIFAGTVITMRHVRKRINATGYYEVHCLSDEWLLDRRMVLGRYPEEDGTAAVRRIMVDVGALEGNEFTTLNVEPGLPMIDGGYEAVWQRPSQVLTNLAVLCEAYWYLDDKDLHFFTEEEFGPQPAPLTTGNSNFEDFEYLVDLSQVRTLVTVEGKSSACPNAVAIGQTSLVVEDGSIFSVSGGYARIGPNAFTYEGVSSVGSGDDIVWTLTGIPAVNDPGVALAIVVDLEAGLPVVTYYQATDAAAVTALIALEGGDGLHDHLIQDDTLDVSALSGRATAELAAFSAPVASIRYNTRDLNTRTGRIVRVTLPSPYDLTEEPFVIQRVEIRDFDKVALGSGTSKVYPLRYVQASPVRLTSILDLLGSLEPAKA